MEQEIAIHSIRVPGDIPGHVLTTLQQLRRRKEGQLAEPLHQEQNIP